MKYDEYMDNEVIELCDRMNSLPGIETFESCCGHGRYPFRIFFNVHDDKGIFILTRCVDRRYWQYGHKWKIYLSVGDQFKNEHLPTTYILESQDEGEDAYIQANDLVENINYHMKHDAFLKVYNLYDLLEK